MTITWGELAERLSSLAQWVEQKDGVTLTTETTELPTPGGPTSYVIIDWQELEARILRGGALAEFLRDYQGAFPGVVVAMAEVFDDSGDSGVLLQAARLASEMMTLELRESELEASNDPRADLVEDIKLAVALSTLVGQGFPIEQSILAVTVDNSVVSGVRFGLSAERLRGNSEKEFWERLSDAGWNGALVRASRIGAELGLFDPVLRDTACHLALDLGVRFEQGRLGNDKKETSLKKVLDVCAHHGIALDQGRVDSLAFLTARTLDAVALGLSNRRTWEF